MNAIEESVFACCYTEWDIVRLGPSGEPRTWRNDVTGASQIVVAENRLALVGGYQDSRDRVAMGVLTADRFEPMVTTSVAIDGQKMSWRELLVASGRHLHALRHEGWYRWELT